VFDNRQRIVSAEADASGSQLQRWRLPRTMDPSVREAGQFRDPPPDVSALGIEFFALRDGIKNAKERRRVVAAARYLLPATGVVGEVGVDERVPEPCLTDLPGHE
jgi:hypothetical protein